MSKHYPFYSSSWLGLSLATGLPLLAACSYMRTGYLLDSLNAPAAPASGAPKIDVPTRIARLVRDALADSYIDRPRVATWMAALETDTAPLDALTACLAGEPPTNGYGACYKAFTTDAVTSPRWGVPEAPATVNTINPSPLEVDAERFLANVTGIGSSLSELQHIVGVPLAVADLKAGIKQGAADAAAYVMARQWHRDLKRPSTALVLSGGSANGAFTAGAIWRLFEIFDACRGSANGGCGDARIDLVAGTSTGSLIGVLVDMYFAGQQQKARDLLVSNYTCTVESDLYCVNSNWDWNLATKVRGLVHFDGIQDRLAAAMTPALDANATELVTVAVEYASGDVYATSDQDPIDQGPTGPAPAELAERQAGRINAVMSSIVEPVLADPVDWLPSRGKRITGTFIDGGIRSGLPLMQAVQRGAERVLLFSNSGIEPDRIANPPNAVGMLMRSMDLMVDQPRVAEVQQGELSAVARRFTEFNVCVARLEAAEKKAEITDDKTKTIANSFCSRQGSGFTAPDPDRRTAVAAGTWSGPGYFDQVATSWRSSWVYRPESAQLQNASGYAFTPTVMRPLFASGVETFQKRCREFTGLLEIHGSIAKKACDEPVADVVARAQKSFTQPVEACTTGKPAKRTCP